ncbi:MAG: ATP-binding protein [Nanoarchaeota archaeon]|nr:ATP-binding protein [Nanoarchaeota archaeon]
MEENDVILLRELQRENVWWQLNDVPEHLARQFKRSDYSAYIDYVFDNDKINVIIGPRQIGKTTILYQLIRYLIKERRAPSNHILFLSLERPFFEITKNPITESVRIFEEYILKQSIPSLEQPIYLFIDEASRNPEWAVTLKQYIDLKYKIKCLVSGSSSPALYQKGDESLVGRKNDIIILPLKFRDVLRFKNLEIQGTLQSIALILRERFKEAIVKKNPEIFFKEAIQIFTSIGPEDETNFQIVLNDYLLRGGYPEFYDKNRTWLEVSKIMREAYFEAIISYDILRVFNLRNVEKFRKLYVLLAIATGNIISVSNIQRSIGDISRGALDDYFQQLQATYLINTSLVYKKNKAKMGNELKKVYVNDVGMRNAVLGLSEEDIKRPENIGPLAESVAYNHIRRLKFCLEPEKINEVFFWRNNQNSELDFIVEVHDKIIPIELKFQETIRAEDKRIVEEATEKFQSPFGILLTKKSFHLSERIISLPLWFFLLMC